MPQSLPAAYAYRCIDNDSTAYLYTELDCREGSLRPSARYDARRMATFRSPDRHIKNTSAPPGVTMASTTRRRFMGWRFPWFDTHEE